MLTNKVLAVLAVAAQILIFSTDTDAACKVPPELQDKDWVYEYTDVSTGETMTKTLSFGSTTIQQGISLEVQGSNINAWTCLSDLTISDTESVAVFKSDITFDTFLNNNRRLYLCMRFTKVTDDLFYFYLMSDKNSLVTPKERVFSPVSEPETNADVCSTYCSYGDPKPMIRTLRKPDTADKLPTDADLCENCGDSCIVSVPCTVSGKEPFTTGPTDGSYNYMDTITYSCNPGYEVQSGNRERTCQPDGTWSGSTLVCAAVKCQDPENGQFTKEQTSPGYNFPDGVTYSCIFGYEVQSGDLERSCQADGTWSGNPPVCKMTIDFFCETLLEKIENKGKSEKRSAESPEESSEIDTRGKGKANGKLKNLRKGRRCGYYKALEALILETCLES
ncbi:Hypothetical predicted protein [Mytilus galloprovincialis]|uniref:Sushi domain-containing protein n=1 Tax=Mytilus galloprovincialis TaxID=29158 RepID=A0A8B6CUN9_MYTGA|nr:Hypothetical predicted protein [Mytilus galloprovincialis]